MRLALGRLQKKVGSPFTLGTSRNEARNLHQVHSIVRLALELFVSSPLILVRPRSNPFHTARGPAPQWWTFDTGHALLGLHPFVDHFLAVIALNTFAGTCVVFVEYVI